MLPGFNLHCADRAAELISLIDTFQKANITGLTAFLRQTFISSSHMDDSLRAIPPNQRTAVLTHQWDLLQTDTERLAQEAVCKQQQQMHTGEYVLPSGKLDPSLQRRNSEVADANNDPSEDDMAFDSIQVAAHSKRATETGSDTHKSKLDSSDVYSELPDDPNCNINKKGAAITGNLNRSVLECHHFPRQTSGQSQKPFIRGYRYIADTSSTLLMIPTFAGSDCDQPFHLHPQDDQVSSITAQLWHSSTLCRCSPKFNSSRGCCGRTTHEQSKDQVQNSCDNLDTNIKRSLELPEHMEEKHTMYFKEHQTCYQKELQHIPGGSFHISPTTASSQTLGKKKPQTQTEDLVERNKITLGRITSDQGSYVNMHALHQKKHQTVKKDWGLPPQEAPTPATPPIGCFWNRGMEHGPLRLNVPHLSQEAADVLPEVTTAECPKESSDPELWLTQQLKVTHITEGSKQGNIEPYYSSMEKSLELDSTTALKCVLSIEEGEHKWCPNEDCIKQNLENIATIPSSTSHKARVYTKLPPIMRKECCGLKTINSHHRNSPADFLEQMEDKLKTRTNYKTYSLKEYKELKLDVKLQGLGPDYTAVKKLAEKMTQQKLYSNGVRERNRNISKIPFLLAKEPLGKERKVARIKALEYAKTIAKPLIQPPHSKSSKKQQTGGAIGHTSCLEDWNISQLAPVDLLMKRHEEEKDALFRKMHVI
ncbi:jhy protein homolog isoform X2 [Syngnathoides biaculeatus]|uniref:jhy protein homolog isoform X2 n=1 Tax=Syngnathoides biaculeatus TaxID=300417 RepID=UPI002ADD64A0|nr:jhy protein homolog isoform X2 [Syngnathoides biaculeatus]